MSKPFSETYLGRLRQKLGKDILISVAARIVLEDASGKVLFIKRTDFLKWGLPGGHAEENESIGDLLRREVLEETGLTVDSGRLVCVDFLRPRPRRPGGLRFLFDCGTIRTAAGDRIVLQAEEISECRWVTPDEAGQLLSGPVGRRVGQALAAAVGTLYLEDGRPVPAVTG
jgi:8-oxo-dGTP diphosphatase